MSRFVSIGALFLGLFLLGCSETVRHSGWDATPIDVTDASSEQPQDASDGGLACSRGTLSLSPFHACALDARGAVWCCGQNNFGQLGDGTTENRRRPVRVVGIDGATQIAVADASSCARLRNGTLTCWGLKFDRVVMQEPIRPDARMLTPQLVPGIDRVRSIGVSSGLGSIGNMTCVVRDDDRVWCWGSMFRVPGHPEFVRTPAPTTATTLSNIKSIHLETFLKCALSHTGVTSRWGRRPWDYSLPLDLVNFTDVDDAVDIASGEEHMCLVARSGAVRCIGHNRNGQLDDGTMRDSIRTFVNVRGLSNAVAISSGRGSATIALRADGTVVQWGYDRIPALRALAVVPGLSNAVEISQAWHTGCARRNDGVVLC